MPHIQFSCVVASALSVRSVDVNPVAPASHGLRDHYRKAAPALHLDQSFLVPDARHQAAAVRAKPLHPGETRIHRSLTRSFPLYSRSDSSKRRKNTAESTGAFPPHPVAHIADAFFASDLSAQSCRIPRCPTLVTIRIPLFRLPADAGEVLFTYGLIRFSMPRLVPFFRFCNYRTFVLI